jgi:hypothetical protein|tara:strand:+ start:201 stop:347 length:147 start_codon:yes stop_codon:yes gene_type:complete
LQIFSTSDLCNDTSAIGAEGAVYVEAFEKDYTFKISSRGSGLLTILIE